MEEQLSRKVAKVTMSGEAFSHHLPRFDASQKAATKQPRHMRHAACVATAQAGPLTAPA